MRRILKELLVIMFVTAFSLTAYAQDSETVFLDQKMLGQEYDGARLVFPHSGKVFESTSDDGKMIGFSVPPSELRNSFQIQLLKDGEWRSFLIEPLPMPPETSESPRISNQGNFDFWRFSLGPWFRIWHQKERERRLNQQ